MNVFGINLSIILTVIATSLNIFASTYQISITPKNKSEVINNMTKKGNRTWGEQIDTNLKRVRIISGASIFASIITIISLFI